MREENLERELDAALARYASVEPRADLEQRVLANLHAREGRTRLFGWVHWVAAGVALASLATLLIWAEGRQSIALNPSSQPAQHEMASTSTRGRVLVATGTPSEGKRMNDRTRRGYLTGRSARGSAGTIPKLAQFPAPQPLTEQEKLLIEFVKRDPEEAALVAQIQTATFQHEVDEMRARESAVGLQQQAANDLEDN